MNIFASRLRLLAIALQLQSALVALSHAQGQSDDRAHSLDTANLEITEVVAYLGQQPLTLGDVYFHLGRPVAVKPPPAEATQRNPGEADLSPIARENAIHLIGQQRQALQTLRKLGLAARPDEVEQWIKTSEQPVGIGATAEEIIQQIASRFGIAPDVYVDQVTFRLSWQRYLSKHLNAANMQRHFEAQKPRFDGTRFKIEMLSVPVPAGMSLKRSEAEARLTQVARGEIANDAKGLRDFAAEIDSSYLEETWIRGNGDMDAAVMDALLATEDGKLTSVFHTATGVHLARLMDREPGDLSLEKVEGEVRLHMLIFLLQHLAVQSAEQLPLRAAGAADASGAEPR